MATNSSIALITGGTSGIGRAVTNKLAQLRIHVLVVGRNAARGEKTVAEIRAGGGKADFISSDLRDASSAREVARKAVALGDGHVHTFLSTMRGSSRSGRRMKRRKKCLIACTRSTSRCRTSWSRNLLR